MSTRIELFRRAHRRPTAGRLMTAALAAAILLPVAPRLADAHHGWQWAEKDISEITGKIVSVRLGNPHGTVMLDVAGKTWTVEVGQPWRNARAGLKDEMFAKDVVMTVIGNKSARKDERVFKAVRIKLDGKTYDLYPERT
jgi:hypothetical protein